MALIQVNKIFVHWHTIVANRAEVSSLLSKNLPQPSSNKARFSTLLPEKSSRQTLNMCKIRWDGTTLNLVKLHRNVIFCKYLCSIVSQQKLKYKSDLSSHSLELFDHVFLSLEISEFFIQLGITASFNIFHFYKTKQNNKRLTTATSSVPKSGIYGFKVATSLE